RRLPHRSLFRLRGADLGGGCRATTSEPLQDLEGQVGVRQDGAGAGRHVPEELHQVRKPRHAGRQGGGAGSTHRGGVSDLICGIETAARESGRFYFGQAASTAPGCRPARCGSSATQPTMNTARISEARGRLSARPPWLTGLSRKSPTVAPSGRVRMNAAQNRNTRETLVE